MSTLWGALGRPPLDVPLPTSRSATWTLVHGALHIILPRHVASRIRSPAALFQLLHRRPPGPTFTWHCVRISLSPPSLTLPLLVVRPAAASSLGMLGGSPTRLNLLPPLSARSSCVIFYVAPLSVFRKLTGTRRLWAFGPASSRAHVSYPHPPGRDHVAVRRGVWPSSCRLTFTS